MKSRINRHIMSLMLLISGYYILLPIQGAGFSKLKKGTDIHNKFVLKPPEYIFTIAFLRTLWQECSTSNTLF
jgi:hypothetical protein